MDEKLAALIAKKFIQRRDVKAEQSSNGDYHPVAIRDSQGNVVSYEPFGMTNLRDHMSGARTFGHYLIDSNDKCRLFAFDIDWEKNRDPSAAEPNGYTGTWCQLPDLSGLTEDVSNEQYNAMVQRYSYDARAAWRDRGHPARAWQKMKLRGLSELLARTIAEEFEIPVAVAYTGAKGLHVYGFTGEISAGEAVEAANLVLALAGGFTPLRGKNFYATEDQDPLTGYPGLSIEVFPKQASVKNGGFGNLMRVPLGRNKKNPNDPTFFVDQRAPLGTLAPHPDPVALLESGRPWL